MNPRPIQHTQAQRWIQARADGWLGEAQRTRLDAHLQRCPACRAYEARHLAFDAGLRSQFHDRRAQRQAQPLPALPRVLDSLLPRMRTHMNQKQLIKFAGSLAFGLVLVAMGVSLSMALSMGLQAPQAGQISTQPAEVLPRAEPSAAPSPTPLPWTEASPLTDPIQIAGLLNELAHKNTAAFQNGEWVYTQSRSLDQAGALQNNPSEEWTRLASDGEICSPYIAVVRDSGQEGQVIQIQMNLPDGTTGDLTSLRQGQGQVEILDAQDVSCRLSAASTAAGQLIPFIDQRDGPPAAKKPSKLIEAKAWYAELDGRLTLVITAAFEENGDVSENNRQTYEETRHYDPQNGVLLREHIAIKWADGALFGEWATVYQTQFLAEMPVEVVQEVDLYAQELKLIEAVQAGQGEAGEQARAELDAFRQSLAITTQPDPVAENAPASTEASLDELVYTELEPLVDPSAIQAIMTALQERYASKLAQPGWFLYGPAQPNPQDWMSNRYILTHTLAGEGGCEDLIYYVKDGEIRPQEIHRADGRYGFLSVVDGGPVTDAGADWTACRPENLGMDFPANEVHTLQGLREGATTGQAHAWITEIAGRKYLVLYYDIQFTGSQPTVMDPDTRKLESQVRQQEWKYYDLEWGIQSGRAAVYHLQNGKIVGQAPVEGVIPSYEGTSLVMAFYDELPAELAQAYEDTMNKLASFLGETKP